MAPVYFVLISSLILIAGFDAISSIASRRYKFNHALMAIVSFLIYAGAGFAATRFANQSAGVMVAGCTGFFDATIGWKISMALKANTGNYDNRPTTSKWIITAAVVTIFAAVLGFIASVLEMYIL
jgi:hypothetical protein